MNSTVTMDSLLKSYPSLERISGKDRVRKFVRYKNKILFGFLLDQM
jgi:hypothetical protein